MALTSITRRPITYNGVVLNEVSAISGSRDNYDWYKVDFFGYDFVAARNVEDDRPVDDGIEDYDTYLGRREIKIKGQVVATTSANLTDMSQQLRAAFNPRRAQETSAAVSGFMPMTFIEHLESSNRTLQFNAKPVQPPLIAYDFETGGLAAPFELLLKCRDPRKYSDTITSGNLTSAGTVSASVNNAGDYFTLPKVTITGPVTTPTLTNSTTGEYITVSTDLSSGQEVVVDMLERTISGSANYYQYKTSGSTFPWDINPDATVTLTYSAITVSSSICKYEFRSAWI